MLIFRTFSQIMADGLWILGASKHLSLHGDVQRASKSSSATLTFGFSVNSLTCPPVFAGGPALGTPSLEESWLFQTFYRGHRGSWEPSMLLDFFFLSSLPTDRCLDTLLLWLGFCSNTLCQLWDTVVTGVCLFESCPFPWICHRWTPVKVQRDLIENSRQKEDTWAWGKKLIRTICTQGCKIIDWHKKDAISLLYIYILMFCCYFGIKGFDVLITCYNLQFDPYMYHDPKWWAKWGKLRILI